MRNQKFFVILVFILLGSNSFNFIRESKAQVFSEDYDTHFNLKTGDSNTYIFTDIIQLNNNFLNTSLALHNGTMLNNYIVKIGSIFKIEVFDINSSRILVSSDEQIFETFYYVSAHLNGFRMTNQIFSDRDYGNSFYITKAFNNVSIVEKYVDDNSFSDSEISSLRLDGDFLVYETNDSTVYRLRKVNWKTGWVEKFELYDFHPNGTKFYGYTLEIQSQLDVFGLKINENDLFTFAIIGITGIGVFAIVILFITHTKNNRLIRLNRNLNNPVNQQILQKKKSKSSTNSKNRFDASNAISKLEEIIEEIKPAD